MAVNEQTEDLLERASGDLYRSLNRFGCQEVLKLLTCFSNDDPIVNQLLTKLPSVVSVCDFMFRLPSYEVDEKTFEKLVETHGSIWLKKAEKKEREDNSDTHPKIPKRRKIRKKKTQRQSQPDPAFAL